MDGYDNTAELFNCSLIVLHKRVIFRLAICSGCDEPRYICFCCPVQSCHTQIMYKVPEAWLGKTEYHSSNVYRRVIINER